MTSLPHASGRSSSMPRARNVEPSAVDPNRYPSRRPLGPSEIPSLRSLGREVRALRFADGRLVVRSSELGLLAQVPRRTLWRNETGIRCTRRSTLLRLAKAAARLNPSAGTRDEILDRLIEAAGNALAPPSKYQFRVDRRRLRRSRRRAASKAQRS